MKMFLNKIIQAKKIEIEKEKNCIPLRILEKNLQSFSSRNFKKAISRKGEINIIGEIKKASPSKGVIVSSCFEPCTIAEIYEKNGVSAISVLTEREYFKGELDFIPLIKKTVAIPVLRKDFIIDEYQIYQSKVYGADAILLIVRILEPDTLESFIKLAKKIFLDCLVEIHSLDELKKAEDAGAEIIGINNRDLDTFEVNMETTVKLAPEIKNKIIVSESGIKDSDDIKRLQKAGVNAFLIGEAFMKAENIGDKIKELKK